MNSRPLKLLKIGLFIALFTASTALADTVRINFSESGFIVDKDGNYTSSENSKFVFSNLKFSGACGTVVSKYLKGNTTNNYLKKGARCTVSGTVKRRNGRGVAKTNVVVKNELGTVRASKKTSSAGKFSINFTVLADSPVSYSVVGPEENSDGARVGCTIYSRDHAV